MANNDAILEKISSWCNFFIKLLIVVIAFGFCLSFALYKLEQAGERIIVSSKSAVQDTIKKTMEYWEGIGKHCQEVITECVADYVKSHTDKKLVVFTKELNIEIYKELESRLLWDYISGGIASSRFIFKGNRVQFYVPLAEIKEDHIIYEPVTRTVKVFAPKVRIDKDMVFIQNEPDKVIKEVNGSWSPFGPKLKEVSDAIMQEVKTRTLKEGYEPEIIEEAKVEAQKALEDLFNKVLGEFLKKENLNLQIIMQ